MAAGKNKKPSDWLTRPADWLLSAGGVVGSLFFNKDATSFTVVQMMFATLMLAALSVADRILANAD